MSAVLPRGFCLINLRSRVLVCFGFCFHVPKGELYSVGISTLVHFEYTPPTGAASRKHGAYCRRSRLSLTLLGAFIAGNLVHHQRWLVPPYPRG